MCSYIGRSAVDHSVCSTFRLQMCFVYCISECVSMAVGFSFQLFFSCWFMSVVSCYTACRSSSHALTLVAKHVYHSGVFKLISLT